MAGLIISVRLGVRQNFLQLELDFDFSNGRIGWFSKELDTFFTGTGWFLGLDLEAIFLRIGFWFS